MWMQGGEDFPAHQWPRRDIVIIKDRPCVIFLV
jgi:hypothetical protein